MDKPKNKYKITWSKPSKRRTKTNKAILRNISLETFLEFKRLPLNLLEEDIVIPSVKGAKTPKEELIVLLQVAAEIEHSLMVQYLYAAYSIKSAPNEEPKLTLRDVAIQEMGHFLSVQNLLLFVGGIDNIHLHKDELRPSDKNNPLPFTLEPFSKGLLAKFIAIESPQESDIPEKYREEVEKIHQIGKGKAGVKLNPVGGLYMKIFWLLQKDDNPVNGLMVLHPNEDLISNWHLSDSDFNSVDEVKAYEAEYDIWNDNGAVADKHLTLANVHSRGDAQKLVFAISSQGEGADFDSNGENSHFELFLSSYRNYENYNIDLLNIAINPITRENKEYSNPQKIENEYSVLWADLFNLVYTSLLLDIYSSIAYKKTNYETSIEFVKLIINTMRIVITSTSTVLSQIPLAGNDIILNSDSNCGATFEIDINFQPEPLITKLNTQNLSIIERIKSKITEIQQHNLYQKHIEIDIDRKALFAIKQINFYLDNKQQLILNLKIT